MAIDSPSRRPSEMSFSASSADAMNDSTVSLGAATTPEPGSSPAGVVRLKSSLRPRSYHQILQDFNTPPTATEIPVSPSGASLLDSQTESEFEAPPSPSPRENTARRRKRFSLPAVALQTTAVTVHPGGPNAGGKRFSLVFGSRRTATPTSEREDAVSGRTREESAASKLSELLGRKGRGEVNI